MPAETNETFSELVALEQTELEEADFEAKVQTERNRFYRASRWSGPAGTGSAAALWAVLVTATAESPRFLILWLAVLLAAVSLQIASFAAPRLAAIKHDDGIPVASHLAHITIGAGFGVTLWIDLNATRVGEFRWITLACLFAMSAGVAGYSGPNALGRLVAIPMWFGASTALITTGEHVAAVACIIFAAITIRDMAGNTARWAELLALRVRSHLAAESSQWAAVHDSLTGLLNRAGVMELLTERAADPAHPTSVMFIDLDHFKEVNDRFGHAAGDEVLIETTKRLERTLGRSDVVGRLGGDEFCVVLGTAQIDTAPARLAYRIIEELERPVTIERADDVYISASIGIATLEPGDATPERLLVHADHAMYRAKRTGRRRVVRFDQDLRAEIQERSGLESSLRQAIREDALSVDAQPIFNIQTGEVRAIELLARWRLPGGGSVPPSVFIPLAEEIGLISDLTRSMLRTAGAMLGEWNDDPLLGRARVSVNVSAIEFVRGRLVNDVAETITEFGVKPGQLVLELTESQQLTNHAVDVEQFHVMQAMGARFAIDDFGSGYSSLDQLLSLPIDAVKLDLHLIEKLGVDPRQAALVRSIHNLASVIGQSVIVEGVETQAQLDALLALGASHAQGYFLCRPVPVEELADHLAALGGHVSARVR